LIIISDPKLDNQKAMRSMKRLLEGVEGMKPRMIVCAGRFFSDEV